jgi:hypothetical protein
MRIPLLLFLPPTLAAMEVAPTDDDDNDSEYEDNDEDGEDANE